ncbi:MAG: HEPN domain-containing protein [Desulfobacterales bacterium]|jgi:HEPN domain-containing protein|nr:HEPN domain-containing protein [Desulfobacterales bacterium]
MINIEKHIANWRTGAEEDWQVAEQLLESDKIRHGLYFLHLAMEKMLKAHICQHTNDIAPRLHNLVRLADLCGIVFTEGQKDLLAEINPFNIEGRYPEMWGAIPSCKEADILKQNAEDLFIWLKNQL